jgi:tRNA-binding protein
MSSSKKETSVDAWDALDLRIGRIIAIEVARTRKPTYRLTLDFGPEIGTRVSCGAYRNYDPDLLIGRQIVAIINLPAIMMGPERSEVLVLGVRNEAGETIYLTPERDVPLAGQVF